MTDYNEIFNTMGAKAKEASQALLLLSDVTLAGMLGADLVQVIGHNGVLYKAAKKPKIVLPD